MRVEDRGVLQEAARIQGSPPQYADDLATGIEHIPADARALWEQLALRWRTNYIGTRVRP